MYAAQLPAQSQSLLRPVPRSARRARRGATALIAMLFLLLFTTLSLAMYSMATLNVQGAGNLSDNDRARASAESGLRWIAWRFARLKNPTTSKGEIDAATA